MELLQLRYFCDAARSENFTITAKKFGVPPSAVSQSINRLEKELDVSFFSRHANSIKLNDTGRNFFLKISSSIELIDDAISCISNDKRKRSLSICIDARRQQMINIIEEFKKTHSDIDTNIKHGYDHTKSEFDIIIADYDLGLPEYEKHLIASEKLTIAIHKNNPLSSRKNLTVDMLKNEPFITMNEQRPMHNVVMNVCADFGFTPHITLQSDDPNYVGRLVSLDMGVAIVPEFYSHDGIWDNVICYPIKGYTRDTFAFVLQSKQVLPYVNDFLNLLTLK